MHKKSHNKANHYEVETIYLGEKADLKRAQEGLKKYKHLTRDHPLVVELLSGEYAALTRFGTVSFWNVRKTLRDQFIGEVRPYIRSLRENYGYSDTIEIHLGAKKEKMTFEEVFIRNINVEKIKIISYVSAQSVALDRYENEIDKQLEEVGRVFENLKSSGRTRSSERDLLKRVGQILSVKQNAISNLALFDKPDEAWESEEIENLYNRLHGEYELRDRFDTLNEKIDFLSENNSALLQFVSAQKGNFLELVIVILIVIEIFLFLPDVLPFLKTLIGAT